MIISVLRLSLCCYQVAYKPSNEDLHSVLVTFKWLPSLHRHVHHDRKVVTHQAKKTSTYLPNPVIRADDRMPVLDGGLRHSRTTPQHSRLVILIHLLWSYDGQSVRCALCLYRSGTSTGCVNLSDSRCSKPQGWTCAWRTPVGGVPWRRRRVGCWNRC